MDPHCGIREKEATRMFTVRADAANDSGCMDNEVGASV
jgi:hypothetical protein